MTGSIPRIFDEAALLRSRKRALSRKWAQDRKGTWEPLQPDQDRERANFLMTMAEQDICERLDLVRRTFASVLVFGGHADGLIRALLERPGVERVEVADIVLPPIIDARIQRQQLRSLETIGVLDGSFDLIVSPLLLHWINDLPGVLAQLRRALKPDGLLVANLIGGRSLHELRASFLAVESELVTGVSPHVHPMIDVREMGGLLQRAKFALPVADVDTVAVTYAHPLALMRDLRDMAVTNVLMERRRGCLRRETLKRVVDHYQKAWAGEHARVTATLEIITVTGWAPHESQQKPLQPGSAQLRLADVLNAKKRRE